MATPHTYHSERLQNAVGKLLKKSGPESLDPIRVESGLKAVSDANQETWADGVEPLSLDEFSVAVDGTPLFDYQFETLKRAGLLRASDILRADRPVQEAVLLWGKGAGKDWLSARFIGWLAYVVMSLAGEPCRHFGLATGSNLHCINTAPNEEMARNVFFSQYLMRVIESPPFDQWRAQPGYKATKDDVLFPARGVEIKSMNSRSVSLEGKNVVGWVMDEADDFLDSEKRSLAEDIHKVLRSSAGTRFGSRWVGLVITYTRTEDGFAIKLKEDIETGGALGYFVDVAESWTVNPNISRDTPSIADDYRKDPRDAMARYECKPMATTDAFFEYPEKILQAVDPTLQPIAEWDTETISRFRDGGDEVQYINLNLWNIQGVPGHQYFIGVDGGERKDAYAIAVFHLDAGGQAPQWLCPRCAGNPQFGGDMTLSGSLLASAPYREFVQRPPDDPELVLKARCGICSLTPKEATNRPTVQFWWRNHKATGAVEIEAGGETLIVPRIVEDLLISVKGEQATRKHEVNKSVYYPGVRDAIKQLIQALNVVKVRMDPWQTTESRQVLTSETGADVDAIGFGNQDQYMRARVTKTLLYQDAIRLLGIPKVEPYETRNTEWRRLQRTGKGSVRKIDHPAGGSKDLWDAEAVAIFLAASHACSNIALLM